MNFSVNPTDRHQGCDASTVIGQPISAGGGRLCGPSAGVGLPGGWRAADPHSGHPVVVMDARPMGSHAASTGFTFIGGHGSVRASAGGDGLACRVSRRLQGRYGRSERACVASKDLPLLIDKRGRPTGTNTGGRQACETGQSAIATDVRPTRSRVASKGFAFSRKSAMYSRGSGAAGGSSTLSGSRWTPRTRNS